MMRLVMEGAGLTFWPSLSLVIFLVSCAVLLVWLFRPGARAFYHAMGDIALQDVESTPESRR